MRRKRSITGRGRDTFMSALPALAAAIAAGGALSLCASCSSSIAATISWTGANGNFGSSTNWANGLGPVPASGDAAQFNLPNAFATTFDFSPTNAGLSVGGSDVTFVAGGGSRTYSVTGAASVSGGSLTLGNSSMTLSLGAGGSIAPGAALVLHDGRVNLTGTLTNDGEIRLGGGSLHITGGAGGTIINNKLIRGDGEIDVGVTNAAGGELRAEAGSTLRLSGANGASAGKINLQGGTIRFDQALTNPAAGLISGSGTLYASGGLTNQGQVQFSAGSSDVNGVITSINGSKIIVSGGGLATFFDAVAVNTGAELRVSTGGTVEVFGDLTGGGSVTGGGTRIFRSGSFSGVISGAGQVMKDGSGELTLSNANSYSGATSVLRGTLSLPTAGSTITSSAVTVGGGSGSATLEGIGTVGPLTVSAGGTVAPGNSVGTLHAGATTWNGGGGYAFEIVNAASGGSSAVAGTDYDKLQISGTLTVSATSGSRFIVTIVAGEVANWNPNVGHSWLIASANSISGFDPSKFQIVTADFAQENEMAGFFTVQQSGSGNVHLVYATPEPAAGCLLVLGAAALTRRRPR